MNKWTKRFFIEFFIKQISSKLFSQQLSENKTWRLSSDSKTTPQRHSAACYQLRWMCQYSTALPSAHLSSNFFFTTDEKHLIVYFQLRSKSLDKTTWLECQLAHIFLFVHKSLHDFDLFWKVGEWEEEELNLILMEVERTRVHLIAFLCMHGISKELF